MCIEFQHLSCQVVVMKGLAYLLTYFIAVVITAVVDSVIAVFLENSENDSKLKDWINFGIYCKKITFAFSALALTPLALLTSLRRYDTFE